MIPWIDDMLAVFRQLPSGIHSLQVLYPLIEETRKRHEILPVNWECVFREELQRYSSCSRHRYNGKIDYFYHGKNPGEWGLRKQHYTEQRMGSRNGATGAAKVALDVAGAAERIARENISGIPFMKTVATRASLRRLGYSQEQIRDMTPGDANKLIHENEQRCIRRVVHDIDNSSITEAIRDLIKIAGLGNTASAAEQHFIHMINGYKKYEVDLVELEQNQQQERTSVLEATLDALKAKHQQERDALLTKWTTNTA